MCPELSFRPGYLLCLSREFEDGEHKARPLDPVRGADVYVVQSLHGGPTESANDKLCRLLFFIGALKDTGAARVTAVVPYLCYARKDRRTKQNDPVATRYVASLFIDICSSETCNLLIERNNMGIQRGGAACPNRVPVLIRGASAEVHRRACWSSVLNAAFCSLAREE
jgi:ribose-phosphate pyrophosphokinase